MATFLSPRLLSAHPIWDPVAYKWVAHKNKSVYRHVSDMRTHIFL